MAYSSIGHMGFALVGLAAGTQKGVTGILVYLAIYLVMTLGTFAAILSMRVNGRYVENIADLAGLSRTRKMLGFFLSMMMLSLAGIPPLAGFFAKWSVFLAAIDAGLYPLAVIGMLTSVVACFYYLRIVKVIYLDEPAANFDPVSREVTGVMVLCGLLVLFYWAYPGPLAVAADNAAKSLF
jgi:NADH-quinone oxidoreductase subunit N